MATQEQANRTLAAHADRLITHPNVTSVSVIEDDDGESIIEIGLAGPESGPAAVNAAPLPDSLPIPDAGGRLTANSEPLPVRKRVVGRARARSFTGRERPAHGGDSCGPAATKWFGTLGARVDRKGTACVLSNWHVLYGGKAEDGYPIVQPARGDGGKDPDDTVARNTLGVLNDKLDAAIATIDKPADDLVGTGTRCYGPINGTDAARINMTVKKCGRTTEATQGKVTSVNATVKVDGYPTGERVFKNQIQMTLAHGDGDSGSIILTEKDAAVGLFFAGTDTVAWANQIQDVMDALGVTF